ncbi:MAG TPA: UPF0182 family protein, partial [Limnochordales bacterium]
METTRRIFWLVIGAAALLLAVVLASAHLVTDWWWFAELGHTGVFVRLLVWPWAVRVLGALVFTLILYGNLRITQAALAQAMFRFQGQVPVFLTWRVMRRVLLGASIVLGLLASEAIAQNWPVVARFWYRVPFGIADPLFGRDVGFYIFVLPFYRLVHGSVAGVLFLATLLVLAVYLLARAVEWR